MRLKEPYQALWTPFLHLRPTLLTYIWKCCSYSAPFYHVLRLATGHMAGSAVYLACIASGTYSKPFPAL